MSEKINAGTEKETLSLKGEVVKTYEYGDYMILIYKIIPDASSPLQEFYMATLDDTTTEVAWGVGASIEDALENAAQIYDSTPPFNDDDFNLFRRALEALENGEE